MTRHPLHDTLEGGQQALAQLTQALQALGATVKTSGQQVHLLSCLRALGLLDQTLRTLHHSLAHDEHAAP